MNTRRALLTFLAVLLLGDLTSVNSFPGGGGNKRRTAPVVQKRKTITKSKRRQKASTNSKKSSSQGLGGPQSSRSSSLGPHIVPINFARILQTSCHNPQDLRENVARYLTPSTDPCGKVSSLVLVRLSKMLITLDNLQYDCSKVSHSIKNIQNENNIGGTITLTSTDDIIQRTTFDDEDVEVTSNVCLVLSQAIIKLSSSNQLTVNQVDACIEGVKAVAVISRILYHSNQHVECEINSKEGMIISNSVLGKLVQSCNNMESANMMKMLEPHHLSGLQWAFDTFQLQSGDVRLSSNVLHEAFVALDLPFRIRPGFFSRNTSSEGKSGEDDACITHLTLRNIMEQVAFSTEQIQTSSDQIVRERRGTAWQGYDSIPGFAYSGKVMKTQPFSPVVQHVRDALASNKLVGSEYDCCLVNLYPDGDSGMRYHIDPDQGTLWGYDTSVVSVGATRRFAFRVLPISLLPASSKTASSQPHNFVVMQGDVTHMFGRCQSEYQHAVKTAEVQGERASRSSLVLKQHRKTM